MKSISAAATIALLMFSGNMDSSMMANALQIQNMNEIDQLFEVTPKN